MDGKKRIYNENPYEKANLLSKLLFFWLTPLMKLGYKRPLEETDLYQPASDERTEKLTNEIDVEWKKELKKKEPSLVKAVFRMYYVRVLLATLPVALKEAIRVAQPIFINELTKYFSKEIDLTTASLYGLALVISVLITNITHQPNLFLMRRYGMQMRTSVCGLIYKKMMRLSTVSMETNSKIDVLNLMSNDATRLELSLFFAGFLLISPVQTIIIIVILSKLVDNAILSGLGVIAGITVLQTVFSRLYNYYKVKTLQITDDRINLTSEILNGVRILKMYGWERVFEELIQKLRTKELQSQTKLFTVNALNGLFDTDFPPIITYVSVAVFLGITNAPLNPTYVVLVTSYYWLLTTNLVYFFMRGLIFVVGGVVSLRRVQEFMLQPEILKIEKNVDASQQPYVDVENLNADWKQDSKSSFLSDITFKVESNELLAIVGEVGSGKSSLLMALLGELPNINGNININGSVFYVAQEPWIFSATVKQNILFGKEYNEQRFNEIISVCELKEDLAMFSYGENTMIGDKGVNLSGGQRARISLARAVYADADVYLLDDPLSAVDANVAKNLYNNCINGYLKSKVRILVTHQIHFLTNASHIVLLKNGKIAISGSYQDLMLKNASELSLLLLKTDTKATEKAHEELKSFSRQLSRRSESSAYRNPDIQNVLETVEDAIDEDFDEKRETGSISANVYLIYFKAAFGYFGPIFVVILFVGCQALTTTLDYWLASWSSKEYDAYTKFKNIVKECERNMTFNLINQTECINYVNKAFTFENRSHYFSIYSAIAGAAFLVCIVRSFFFYGYALLTAKLLHEKMLNTVMRTRIRFFDVNPIGRIMNRFAKDIGNIDDVLPTTVFDFCQYSMLVTGTMVMALIVNYYLIIALLPLGVIFVYLRLYYVKTSRELKRIEGLCRSPVYSHATNTSRGIVTIRACKNEPILRNEYAVHSDYHNQAFFAYTCSGSWLAMRIDGIVTVYTLIVVYGCIFLKDSMGLNPGEVGIALVYITQILAVLEWCVELSAQVENLMTSVERTNEYLTLEKEELGNASIKPNDKWPENGAVTFQNTSFAYDKNLPYVLKNVTFDINAREKVGVVGRTGAGKSTIFQTLFRMAEPDGTVLIDGVNIQDISLNDLRSKISIIPQEPTLFMGPLRYNLDPFCENEDKVLWDILDVVQLKDTVKNMQGGLDAQIQKGGSNLSVGQKQLFCLARAILKKSKILIIDEATANVDYKTDALVQKAIRKYFSDCTVITIAHRLHTIMDSDKIICLSDGQLMDFGIPHDLLQDSNSILYQLVNKLAKHERDHLYEIAKSHKYRNVINEEFDDDDDDDFDEEDNFDATVASKYGIQDSPTPVTLADDATSHHERF